MKRTKTYGDVKAGHVITYGTARLQVTSLVRLPEVEHGQRVEVSGIIKRGLQSVGRTFRAGALREAVIHNWKGGQ